MFSSGLTGFNPATTTPPTDIWSISNIIPINNGLQKDFFSNLLGLQSFPIIGQTNNINIATQTPTTTSYQIPKPTPTLSPTVTPTSNQAPIPTLAPTVTPVPSSNSQSLPAAGPNTYTDSDNGKTITINNGDILHIRLNEIHDCAEWSLNPTDGLQVIGNTFYPDTPSNNGPGITVNDGGGTRVYDIKATKLGIQKITATEYSPSSGNSFGYQLTVNVV